MVRRRNGLSTIEVEVGIGHNINVTVTNGIVRPPPSDVAANFYLYIPRRR